MTGTKDYSKGVEILREQYDIKIIFVTLGKDGSLACYKDLTSEQPTFSEIKAIEKTGAGDTFEGCALNYLLEHDFDSLKEENLSELLLFANAGASLITTRKGALKVMPDKTEIENLIRDGRNSLFRCVVGKNNVVNVWLSVNRLQPYPARVLRFSVFKFHFIISPF